jgi:photosystem II stability/assembly factor-like uncharacterized protein
VRGASAAWLVLPALAALAAPAGPEATERAGWALPARLADRSLLLDVAAHGERLIAVGERGHVLVSSDGGRSWRQVPAPTRATLTAVHLQADGQAFAVGHDAVVLRSRDAGESWERVYESPEDERPLLDVWFADARHGLAAAAYGELLATEDGGDSWTRRALRDGDDFHLNQLSRAKDGALYVAAEAGRLYRSDDGGGTWTALASPYEGSFFGVLPLDDGSVLAFGLRGRLFASSDRGRSWTRIEAATEATLLCGMSLGAGRYVVGGMEGTLVWGEGGRTRTEERPDRQAITALARDPEGGLLLFGEGGVRHQGSSSPGGGR